MLHFSDEEFAARLTATEAAMTRHRLDGLLLFAPESRYWLSGHDSPADGRFECLILGGIEPVLLTDADGLAQARLTSNIQDIRTLPDGDAPDPGGALMQTLADLGLSGRRLGMEIDTPGLTARDIQRVTAALEGRVRLADASALVAELRLVKSESELVYLHRAAELADDSLDAAMNCVRAGADEGRILAAMQETILAGGGDYPACLPPIGSGEYARLTRYHTGRRPLPQSGVVALRIPGVYRHYHAPLMRTLVTGPVTNRLSSMHEAAVAGLKSAIAALCPGFEMGAVYDAQAKTLDEMGFGRERHYESGHAVGALFSPGCAQGESLRHGAKGLLRPGMTFFVHATLTDSEAGAVMCPGLCLVITEEGARPLSRLEPQLLRP